MKKSLLTISLVLVAVLLLVVGCGKKSSNPLIGSWDHSGYVYTFNEDKTGNYEFSGTKMEFTYEDDGTTLSILFEGNTSPMELEYKIEGKKLIIVDSFGSDVEYTKK